MAQMGGELGVGHSYIAGRGDEPSEAPVNVGLLGADYRHPVILLFDQAGEVLSSRPSVSAMLPINTHLPSENIGCLNTRKPSLVDKSV